MSEQPEIRVHPTRPRRRDRVFPQPATSLVVAITWVLLANSVHPGTLIFAALLGFIIPLTLQSLMPVSPRIYSWRAVIRFLPVFLWDVVMANLAVALLILQVGRKPRCTWVYVPVDATDPFAATAFAAVISLTPGTVSSRFSKDRRTLLVHALDTDDPEGLIAEVKARYEAPLRRIFEP